ncbi:MULTISPECIES: type II secretion system F family protein [unclassified Corynebacterium]|uniref:type II secretion system F family protein n=1 Tax=unclassified Corynebacterium TaxID=2624378 RepID=UPI0029C9F995|nr:MULTISPECIES: type II secretion system F family protein [unclassified Corynebacterium]WPF66321.1 type II secretion system F family protein [Corynebacterium sp. 22KM0430]WPF68811.1 type II secretion system F family protein [Corynebacterium sp. 21KM1197]
MIPALLLALALMIVPVGARNERLHQERSATRPRDGPRGLALRHLVERVRARVTRGRGEAAPGVAAEIDLYAECLASGLSPAVAAKIVGECSTSPVRDTWHTVAALLAIGVPPERAWAEAQVVPGLRDVAHLACHSHHSGVSFARAAAEVADDIRRAAEDRATATAERAGVLIAMPLTLCFLPAFFLLGLAPVVIGVAREIF